MMVLVDRMASWVCGWFRLRDRREEAWAEAMARGSLGAAERSGARTETGPSGLENEGETGAERAEVGRGEVGRGVVEGAASEGVVEESREELTARTGGVVNVVHGGDEAAGVGGDVPDDGIGLGEAVAGGGGEEMDGTGGAARERTRRRLAELREIPALQSLARQFSSVLNRDAVNVDEVVEAIQRDAALCVRVLRMANSVEVSPGQRIEDLATAVQMLGLQRVRKAARALFTLRDTNRVTEGFDWRHLWVHALGTAALAEELAERLGVAAGEPVYEAALLHDVGKVVLATVAPEEYRAVLTRAWREQGRLEELERAELGVTHREAGAIFGRKSGLGEATLAAIAHHDAPERAKTHRTTVALVAAANYLAKRHGIGFGGARLGEADGEFAALTCWDVMREEGARLPALEEWEDAWYAVAAGVRGELRNLQQVAGLKPVAGRPSLVVEAGRGGKDERRK